MELEIAWTGYQATGSGLRHLPSQSPNLAKAFLGQDQNRDHKILTSMESVLSQQVSSDQSLRSEQFAVIMWACCSRRPPWSKLLRFVPSASRQCSIDASRPNLGLPHCARIAILPGWLRNGFH